MTNKNIAAANVASRRSAARQRAGQLESVEQAIALMLDWTVDLDDWIVANQKKAHRSKGRWESIYEAAVWIIDRSPKDIERDWLAGPRQNYEPRGVEEVVSIFWSNARNAAAKLPSSSIGADEPAFAPRQPYAPDIRAAEMVIERVEGLLDATQREMVRRLANHEPQRDVAKKIDVKQTRLRERRDNAWRRIERSLGDGTDRLQMAA